MKAEDWKPYESGTLRGFFTLLLDSGIKIFGMGYHRKEDRSWVAFPSRQYTDEDGGAKYTPILKIEDDAKWKKFQALAKQAVEAVIGDGQQGKDQVPF